MGPLDPRWCVLRQPPTDHAASATAAVRGTSARRDHRRQPRHLAALRLREPPVEPGRRRKIGIVAPSIRPHVRDLPEGNDAVGARQTLQLLARLTTVSRTTDDPAARLRAMCLASVELGRTNLTCSRLLVGGRFLDVCKAEQRPMGASSSLLGHAVVLMTDEGWARIDATASDRTDAHLDTAVPWFTLHGLITVPQAITSISRPVHHRQLDGCITWAVELKPPTAPKSQARHRQPHRTGQ